MARFRLVETDDIEPLPPRGKRSPREVNMMDELGIPDSVDEQNEEDVYTVSSILYDYGGVKFKSMETLTSYVSHRGFDCDIFKNGRAYGFWSSEVGVTVIK